MSGSSGRRFICDPIPAVDPELIYIREVRKVSNDGYVLWGGCLDPVPLAFRLHDVLVEKLTLAKREGNLMGKILT